MTLKELKKRSESGEKQVKSVKARLKAQKARVCSQRGCHESLAFRDARVVLCNAHRNKPVTVASTTNSKKRPVKRITKAEQRKLNKEKKKRYNEKHGIVYNKNVRNRDAKPKEGTSGIEYTGQTLLYENYKEPLKAIEKGKGFGYYGTVAITDDKAYIQCHICGHLWPNVGAHLRKHKITATDYKKKYGLAIETALISEPVRERMQKTVVSHNPVVQAGNLPEWLAEYNRKVQSGEIKHMAHGGTSMSLEKRNKLGLCPDQVLEKIREYADELGHAPSYDEFKAHYKGKYYHSIIFQHGSYSAAVKKLGLKTAQELKSPDNETLLQSLRDFHDRFARVPTKSDFERGLVGYPRQMYWRRWGSLNNARIEAGLNAVLPMPFRQIVEMTPEAYIEYKGGQNLEKYISPEAIRHRKKREKQKQENLRSAYGAD
jgi:Homing endonuclease associated repeat/ROS/MUCR transcriptional regulator protein